MFLSSNHAFTHQRLGELAPGDAAEIIGFNVEEALHPFLQRLLEVGFLVGEKIEVLQQAPFSKDPMSIKVRNVTYALRREDANLIQVKPLSSSP